jgi:hypothetical protein
VPARFPLKWNRAPIPDHDIVRGLPRSFCRRLETPAKVGP